VDRIRKSMDERDGKMKKLGIFSDRPDGLTENTIVCENIAKELTNYMDRVVYFGRGNMPIGQRITNAGCENIRDSYEIVDCETGTWKADLVEQIIRNYKLDIIFACDMWSNISGLIQASQKYKVPLHFLTPIDSLPISKAMHQTFKKCTKVYVPNSSADKIKNGCYLPYGIDYRIFKPITDKKSNKFTFIWSGRDEEKKDLGSAFLAFEKIYKEIDAQMIIRTDWNTERLVKKVGYFKRGGIPIIIGGMDNPHYTFSLALNASHVYLCTSKLGAWEMELTEALSCGLPVLCTDAPFMNRHITNEKNGFLIPTENGSISIEKLTEKMIWCYKNPKIVLSMGLYGAGDIRGKYGWNKTGELLCNEMEVE